MSAKHRHGRLLSSVHSEVDERRREGWSTWAARLIGLLPGLWAWLRYRLRQKHPLVPLEGDEGVHPMLPASGPTRVAVAADWGSGSDDARRVAAAIERLGPDYTIHLGDIYSVGSEEEVARNFLGEDGGVAWPPGRFGALAVPGNHEYQSGAHAFYGLAMRRHLGVKEAADWPRLPQQATYWSLESAHWAAVGLDTGYHSVKKFPWELIVQVLNWLPGVSRFQVIQKLRTKLPAVITRWLVDRMASGKALLVLTHHQPVTSLDRRGSHRQPAEQIARLPGGSPREVAWLCGHGHRLEIHAGVTFDGLTVHARTVGHGQETDVVRLRKTYRHLRYADNRPAADEPGQGFPGFAVLTFDGPELSIDYVVLEAGDQLQVVFRETFAASGGNAVPGASSHATGPGFYVAGLPASAEVLPVELRIAASASGEG